MNKTIDMDWANLGFQYIKTDYRYISLWKDGAWDKGMLTQDSRLHISEGSTAIHYGQQCFEGMKAFRTKDQKVVLFRPEQNARRMNGSCRRVMMPEMPETQFIAACIEVVRANASWVPPYGSGASLYLRPYMIGVGDNIGVRPAQEYLFGVFCIPVGPYFKNGFRPVQFMVSEFDRAAPRGTGAAKVGGNYGASLLSHHIAVAADFADCIYLDPLTHTKIEEAGSSNFFGITEDRTFITPKSDSLLPSITKYSLIHIAKNYLGMKTVEGDIYIDKLDHFTEAGACGTAAVITPIGEIHYKDTIYRFGDSSKPGPYTEKLYQTLVGIQLGEIEAPEDWLVEVNVDVD